MFADKHGRIVCGRTQTHADASVCWLGLVQPNEPPVEAHVRQMTDLES